MLFIGASLLIVPVRAAQTIPGGFFSRNPALDVPKYDEARQVTGYCFRLEAFSM
jgi:hypothetical protein